MPETNTNTEQPLAAAASADVPTAELDKTARPANQITKKLIFPAQFRPLVDYWLGAWVECETHPGVREPVRLPQVTHAL